jgi:hypothetical protein
MDEASFVMLLALLLLLVLLLPESRLYLLTMTLHFGDAGAWMSSIVKAVLAVWLSEQPMLMESDVWNNKAM